MRSPLVSIIIPCYQSAKTIGRTLQSIYRQSYRTLEIIAVNDGSTDATRDILSGHEHKVRIIHQDNKGAAAARNKGFDVSRGEFVLFCDDDVVLQPDMIEKMVRTLEQYRDKAYCYCNFKFGWHTFDLFPFDAARLRRENYISTMSLMRRETFIGFDESLRRYQDWDLWKRMLDRGSVGVWYPERLFTAPHGGGISKHSLRDLIKIIVRRIGLGSK